MILGEGAKHRAGVPTDHSSDSKHSYLFHLVSIGMSCPSPSSMTSKEQISINHSKVNFLPIRFRRTTLTTIQTSRPPSVVGGRV